MKTFLKYGLVALLSMAMAVLILSMAGCFTLQKPDKANYSDKKGVLVYPYAYFNAVCMHLAQKNPDKSACVGYIDIIKDREVEKRYYDKLTFCMGDDKPPGWSQETCRYYLNQK